ncbi:MAG: hypothetical protein HY314_12515 [Acidobacteria bacterium]|nr:hypothetical protein [Acidobacteriota bacterium]
MVNVRAQQQPPTPNDQPQIRPYTVTANVELGVRGVSVDGNADKYRSDLNYQLGFRLFDSSFLMRSNGADGTPFDTLLVYHVAAARQ